MSILYGSATSYNPPKKKLDLQEVLNLAIKYHQSGNLNEAKINYEKVLKVDKNNFNALNLLGVLFYQIGENSLAIEYIKKAITINSNYTDSYYNLALAYEAKSLIDEAIKCYEKVIELNPTHLISYNSLGNIYEQKENFDKAIEYYKKVIGLSPNFKTYNNLGNIYKELRDFNKAIYYFELSMKFNPNIAEIYYNLANTQKELNLIDEAIKNYQKAIEINPSYVEAYNNLAIALLSIGDLKNGFKYYKYRYDVNRNEKYRVAIPNVDIPYWQGENLKDKTILLLREQGLGDEIFFLRFAKKLKEMGAKVIYNPANKIKSIIARCSEIDEVINDDKLNEIKADFALPIGDLPFLLNSYVAEPLKLSPLIDRIKEIKEKIKNSAKPLIALTYRAGVNKEKFLFKNVDLNILVEKLKDIDANFVLVQREPLKEEIEFLKDNLTIYDFTHLNDDLEGMLALLSLVDDYIAVSNTNIHLYAGLNKSSKVLIPHPPEWRWMREGNSLWFKHFNVYRQEIDGSWDKALNELISDFKS